MTERYQSGSFANPTSTTAKMTNDLTPRKTMIILVIVVGCFAVLWPKVFYPMLVGPVNHPIKPIPIDKSTGCCDVISETDVNTIKIMSELCKTIIKTDEDMPLTGKELISKCQSAVLETCGIDISEVLQQQVKLGQSVKQILDEIRSLNGSLCLKYNFGVAPWKLGVPHRVTLKMSPSTVRQERPLQLRSELIHPAFRERGRAIPQPQATTPRATVRVVEGRPGPVPGMRPTLGGAGHVVPPPKQGTGSMGLIMPIYTIGIVVFFTYTVLKIIFKKQPEALYPPVEPDPNFRREVFESESIRPATKLTREGVSSKLVVNAMSALLDEVDQEIETRHSASEFVDQNIVANGTVPKEEEQPSVKVLGMEMTASCEGGKKWSRPNSPALHPAWPPQEPPEPPQEIFLEGALPAQSHLLVADSATEAEKISTEDDPAVVLAGKMTLSVISLDSTENGTGDISTQDKKQERAFIEPADETADYVQEVSNVIKEPEDEKATEIKSSRLPVEETVEAPPQLIDFVQEVSNEIKEPEDEIKGSLPVEEIVEPSPKSIDFVEQVSNETNAPENETLTEFKSSSLPVVETVTEQNVLEHDKIILYPSKQEIILAPLTREEINLNTKDHESYLIEPAVDESKVNEFAINEDFINRELTSISDLHNVEKQDSECTEKILETQLTSTEGLIESAQSSQLELINPELTLDKPLVAENISELLVSESVPGEELQSAQNSQHEITDDYTATEPLALSNFEETREVASNQIESKALDPLVASDDATLNKLSETEVILQGNGESTDSTANDTARSTAVLISNTNEEADPIVSVDTEKKSSGTVETVAQSAAAPESNNNESTESVESLNKAKSSETIPKYESDVIEIAHEQLGDEYEDEVAGVDIPIDDELETEIVERVNGENQDHSKYSTSAATLAENDISDEEDLDDQDDGDDSDIQELIEYISDEEEELDEDLVEPQKNTNHLP